MYDAVILMAAVVTIVPGVLNLAQLFTGQTPTPDQSLRASVLRVVGKFLNRVFSVSRAVRFYQPVKRSVRPVAWQEFHDGTEGGRRCLSLPDSTAF